MSYMLPILIKYAFVIYVHSSLLVPPLIINRASQTILAQGEDFIFNCTSGPANPLAVNYTIQKDRQAVDGGRATVQGPVLTIISVQSGDGGKYSCSANNSVGSDTVHNSLISEPGTAYGSVCA